MDKTGKASFNFFKKNEKAWDCRILDSWRRPWSLNPVYPINRHGSKTRLRLNRRLKSMTDEVKTDGLINKIGGELGSRNRSNYQSDASISYCSQDLYSNISELNQRQIRLSKIAAMALGIIGSIAFQPVSLTLAIGVNS